MDELSLRPITASIETKRLEGAKPGEAHLQIGTWHAAQWRLLEDIVRQAPQDVRASGKSKEQDVYRRLPAFLPAVVINGHDWSFAATTRKGRKTVRLTTYPGISNHGEFRPEPDTFFANRYCFVDTLGGMSLWLYTRCWWCLQHCIWLATARYLVKGFILALV